MSFLKHNVKPIAEAIVGEAERMADKSGYQSFMDRNLPFIIWESRFFPYRWVDKLLRRKAP